MKFWIVFLFLSSLYSHRVMAEELRVTFAIEADNFNVAQNYVYDIGNFDRELSEAEILGIMQDKRYQFSEKYFMEFQRYSYWVIFFDNKTDKTQKIYLRYPMQMPKTKAWLYRPEGLIAFERYPSVFDIYFAEIPPGLSTVVGMRLSGGTVKGRATTISAHDFASIAWIVTSEQHVMGSVFGAIAIMILYNLGMYLFFRKVYFLYYSLYSASAIYCLSVFSSYTMWNLQHLAVGLSVSGVGLVLFCNSALSLRNIYPVLYKVSLAVLVYCVGIGIYVWFHPVWNVIAISMPLVLFYCIFVSVKRARDGFRPANYLVIGWVALSLATLFSVFNIAFWGIPALASLAPYGFALEICFFSFAVGQKVRLSEQKALRESEHAFNQLKKVFYPHQIQQIKAGTELEKTMPTGKEFAAVISFDIIESSKIRLPQAKIFIEDSIKSCVSIISENYEPDRLQSNGYRIKEVGDGFLCSVGYPFQLPVGMTRAECAVDMSLRFIDIFQEQVERLRDHPPVHCSIGVAMDWLEGYFPKVGTIEYDVYGRAIILATRYEAFRRQLFPDGVPGHILTLHEKIYDNLPAKLRAHFVEVDLHKEHLVVRDDLGASKLYYRIIKPEEMAKVSKVAS